MNLLRCMFLGFVFFFVCQDHAMILNGQLLPQMGIVSTDSIEPGDRSLSAESLLVLSNSGSAMISSGANVTVHVLHLSDGIANASECDISLTGLPSCNLRSALAFCIRFITKSLPHCNGTMSFEIVLPGGSTSFLKNGFGGSLAVTDHDQDTTCPIALSITSSNSSLAKIQGDNAYAGLLRIVPDQGVSVVKRVHFSYLLIYNFGAVNANVISLESVKAVIFDHVTLKSNEGQSKSLLGIVNSAGIVFNNCIFQDNIAPEGSISAVGIWDSENVLFNQCNFTNNRATTYNTNAIYISNSTNLIVRGCRFSNGGVFAIYLGLNVSFVGCTFTSNTNQGYGEGGALALLYSRDVMINACSFVSNDAYAGGALCLRVSSDVIVKNCTFQSNTAYENGGAVFATYSSRLIFMANTFNSNKALYGGAFYASNLYYTPIITTFTECFFYYNMATKFGGALRLNDINCKNFEVNNCTFIENHSHFGGAVNSLAGFILQTSYFQGNTARVGGALNIVADSKIIDCKFVNNTVLPRVIVEVSTLNPVSGGAVYIFGKTNTYMIISGSTFIDNHANRTGGAIAANFVSNIAITGSLFLNNSAEFQGGAISFENYCTGVSITRTNFTSNIALSNGGGISFTAGITFVNIFHSSFSKNQAIGGSGGAVYFTQSSNTVSIGGLQPLAISNLQGLHNTALPGVIGYYVAFNSSTNLAGDKANNEFSITGGNLLFNVDSMSQDISDWPGIGGNEPLFFSVSDIYYDIRSDPNNGFSLYFTLFPILGKEFATVFDGNSAKYNGGAIYWGVSNSNVFVMPWTVFTRNSASKGYGGAIDFHTSNSLLYLYSTIFTGNTAPYGGAVALSRLNYPALFSSCFFVNNSALYFGGAVYMGDANGFGFDAEFTLQSVIFFNTSFHDNSAASNGGAVALGTHTSVVFNHSQLVRNSADIDGGAIYAYYQNKARFVNSTISHNTAGMYGGALSSLNANYLLFEGRTIHQNNHAGSAGGSLYSSSNTYIEINDDAQFNSNTVQAGNGGAISMDVNSSILLQGTVNFEGNSASNFGGAIYSSASSVNFGEKNVLFHRNIAAQGSAMRLELMPYHSFFIRGLSNATANITFSNNNCTKRGGTVSWVKEPTNTSETFSNKTIQNFRRIKYENNIAIFVNETSTQAVYLTTLVEETVVHKYFSVVLPHPTFELFDYFDNRDMSDYSTVVTVSVSHYSCSNRTGYLSGSTSESAKNGSVKFNTLLAFCFPGGNMTLNYIAKLEGYDSTYNIVAQGRLHFRQCVDGEVLVDNQCRVCRTGSYSFAYDPTATCQKCPENTADCNGASIIMSPGYWGINQYAVTALQCPYGEQACLGGRMNATFEFDGVEIGSGRCAVGYEGPLCALCSPQYYFSQTTSKCTLCVGQGSTQLGLMIGIPLAILLIAVYLTFSNFLIQDNITKSLNPAPAPAPEVEVESEVDTGTDDVQIDMKKEEDKDKDKDDEKNMQMRIKEWMSQVVKMITPKVKIMLTVFQIISGFPFSLNIQFPVSADKMFRAFSVMNFSALPIGSPQCYAHYDYIDKLIMQTSVPLVLTGVLLLSCALHLQAVKKHVTIDKSRIITRYITLFFLLTYFILPSVTTAIFGAFVCQSIDPDNVAPGTPKYLRNDLSISCSSNRYKFGVNWAIIMIFVFPIGITSMYTYVLYCNKDEIITEKHETKSLMKKSVPALPPTVNEDNRIVTRPRSGIMTHITPREIHFLHRAYRGQCWYWEVVETARRLMLTAVVSVVATGSSAQIVWGIIIALMYMKLYTYFRPFKKLDDDILNELTQYQVFFTLFISLLIRSNSLPGPTWSTGMDVILVLVNIVSSASFIGSVAAGKDFLDMRHQTQISKEEKIANRDEVYEVEGEKDL